MAEETKQEGAFDLDAHDVRAKAQEGVWMTLLDPARRATGAQFLVRGSDAEEYQLMLKEQIKRWVSRAPQRPTEQEREFEFWELNATLVAGWKGLKTKTGLLVYSPAECQRLLKEQSYIFEQVRRFADDRANFLPGPVGS